MDKSTIEKRIARLSKELDIMNENNNYTVSWVDEVRNIIVEIDKLEAQLLDFIEDTDLTTANIKDKEVRF